MAGKVSEDRERKAWATAGRIASLSRAIVGGRDAKGKMHPGANPVQLSKVARKLRVELDRFDATMLEIAGAE